MVRLLSDHSTPFPDKLVSHRACSEHGNHAKADVKALSGYMERSDHDNTHHSNV